MNGIEKGLTQSIESNRKIETESFIKEFLQEGQLVGDLYSINYETAKVIIHDYYRQKVGGIPSLSFLLASRVDPNDCANVDFKAEDSSFILLRVMDRVDLPQDAEAERIRVETAQKVVGDTKNNFDSPGAMDYKTKNLFSYAGVQCRIIGTFFLEEDKNNSESPLRLKFGCDISNYYPNRGLKVYKPTGRALEKIVNYIDNSNEKNYNPNSRVKIGHVRYASTNRKYQNADDVPVYIYPFDLLCQKTALFGMTRTGKSNTTKIIAKSVFELRKNNGLRIGQVIFDPNGEYANDNEQDNNSALKNVWKLIPEANKANEVATYGITKHPNDTDRKLMKVNFFLDENLQIGKEIINALLSSENSEYVKSFCQVIFEKPDENDYSAITRYKRKVLTYRSLLVDAGFVPPQNMMPYIKGLFGQDLQKAMANENSASEYKSDYQSAAELFSKDRLTWEQLSTALKALDKFIHDKKSGYDNFEQTYIHRKDGSGEKWADTPFLSVLDMYQYYNGVKKIAKAVYQHSATTSTDYADDIYRDLVAGKLVVIDQSTGDPELNKSSAKRIITKIFQKNQQEFIKGSEKIPEILVYVEEAHNILPAGNDLDTSDMWVRTAKEGAKYHIGMVYATQEVSSIQKNILKNTSNWFISHLNNTDETKELCKYYDFADFEPSIRRAQDKGFLRVKTLSNLFVIPVQVDKFDLSADLSKAQEV